jgi:hypothetical protein
MDSAFSAAIAFRRAAISSSASSQLMRLNSPLPFFPVLFKGKRKRSGA